MIYQWVLPKILRNNFEFVRWVYVQNYLKIIVLQENLFIIKLCRYLYVVCRWLQSKLWKSVFPLLNVHSVFQQRLRTVHRNKSKNTCHYISFASLSIIVRTKTRRDWYACVCVCLFTSMLTRIPLFCLFGLSHNSISYTCFISR